MALGARGLVARRRPDRVHTTLFEADVVGRLAGWSCGVPVVSSLVSTVYGADHLYGAGLPPWKVRLAQAADATTARLVARFHAVSEEVALVMARRLRIPRDRIEVVRRGRDEVLLGRRSGARRSAARLSLGVGDDGPIVLAVARHEFVKGLDVLLEAWPAVKTVVPRARLLVAGGKGGRSAELEQQRRALADPASITWLGTREDVPDLLCAVDAFVLPSRREGLPGALLEAMALETPVVASDLATLREVRGRSYVPRSRGSPRLAARACRRCRWPGRPA